MRSKEIAREILELGKIHRIADESWRLSAGRSATGLPVLPPFKLAIMGSVDSGKTTLIRALVNPEKYGILLPCSRPGPDVPFPVTYTYGPMPTVRYRARGHWHGMVPAPGGTLDLNRLLERQISPVRHVCLTLPDPLLERLNLDLVDMPGIAHDDTAGMRRACDLLSMGQHSVIYLLHSRGLGDEDLVLLDALQLRDVVFLTNLYEAELVPGRAAVDLPLLQDWDPDLAARSRFSFAVPVVPTFLSLQAEDERQALEIVLAALRAHQLSPALKPLERAAARRRRELGRTADHLFHAAARLVTGQASGAGSLMSLAKFLELERWLPEAQKSEQLLEALAEVTHRQQGRQRRFWEHEARGQAQLLADEYNQRAGEYRQDRPADAGVGEAQFGHELAHLRERLLGFICNLRDDDRLDLLSEEQRSLRELDARIREARVEIALMGMFSSGKSSIINAMVGLGVHDKRIALLPTAVRAETATVNRVAYADEARLLRVDWAEQERGEVHLTFLSPTGRRLGSDYRVHVEEVQAFQSWLDRGTVQLGDCQFEWLGDIGSSQDQELGWKHFLTCVKAEDGMDLRRFANRPKVAIPYRVVINAFLTPPPVLEGKALSEAFACLRDPAVSLRAALVHIGSPFPLLRHSAILDTPGTDSHNAHHRQITRDIIKYRRCPVLYCFLSNKAASGEDLDNLQEIQRHESTKDDAGQRFFFAITRRGLLHGDPEQEERVSTFVKQRVAEIGLTSHEPYFVELAQGPKEVPNEEFHRLMNDLERFILFQKENQFTGWISEVEAILHTAQRRASDSLTMISRAEHERHSERDKLSGMIARLIQLREEFKNSTTWGRPWALQSLSREISEGVLDIHKELEGLQKKELFDGIGNILDDLVDKLNEGVVGRLRSIARTIAAKLQTTIAEKTNSQYAKIDAPQVEEYAFFSSTELVTMAGALEWPWNTDPRLWRWDEFITNNRQKLMGAWKHTKQAGEKLADRQRDEILRVFDEHLGRTIADLEARHRSLDPSDLKQSQKRLTLAQEAAAAWGPRLEALQRAFHETVKRGEQA